MLSVKHSLRRLEVELAERTPLGSVIQETPVVGKYLAPSLGRVASLSEWFSMKPDSTVGEVGNDNADWITELASSTRFSQPGPEIVLPPGDIPGYFGQTQDGGRVYSESAKYVAHLKWGSLFSQAFEVLTPDGRLVTDLLFPDNRDLERYIQAEHCLVRSPRPKRHHGRFATIFCGWANSGYSHFIVDGLGRLWLLEESGIDSDFRLIVPKTLKPYQEELLSLLGYGEERRFRLEPGRSLWSFEHLYVPSLASDLFYAPNPPASRWLQKRLLEAAPTLHQSTPSRIYISRERAKNSRDITNEDELLTMLRARGFEKIIAEDFSMVEQIHLFRNAEAVVAPHGAGLTNILFMQSGAAVVELIPANLQLPTYINLAGALGLRYAYVRTDDSNPPQEFHSKSDFAMPLRLVSEALEQLNI